MMGLEWKGQDIRDRVAAAALAGLTEYGLIHETAAKSRLYPGHGKITGTLQRSIHAASKAYNFKADTVTPTASSPSRSGQGLPLFEQGGRISVVVGSGMVYARYIEDLYGYLSMGHQATLPQLPEILHRHARQVGLF